MLSTPKHSKSTEYDQVTSEQVSFRDVKKVRKRAKLWQEKPIIPYDNTLRHNAMSVHDFLDSKPNHPSTHSNEVSVCCQ